MPGPNRHMPQTGRGAASNPANRFDSTESVAADDGWGSLDEPLPKLETIVQAETARTIIARNSSPDIPFTQSINPYRGCENGCVYCLHGDTPILYADGGHRPIRDAKVGDQIIGTVRDGWFRRYAETRIENHWSTIKPAYRIGLADGTELVASGDHRFLTERGWKFVKGNGSGRGQRPHLTFRNRLLGTGAFASQPEKCEEYRRGYLSGLIKGDGHIGAYTYPPRPGRTRDEQQHVFRLALDDDQALTRAYNYLETFRIQTKEFAFQAANGPSRPIAAIRTSRRAQVDAVRQLVGWPRHRTDSWRKGFLAGMFDAEGHHDPSGAIRISNTDDAIIDAIREALRSFGFAFCLELVEPEGRKPLTVVRIKGGLREKLRLFHLMDPAIARKRTIAGISLKSTSDLRVVSIERLHHVEIMYDITTGTGDFIANGVVSHNCYARPSHGHMSLSPGLDFETKLFYKADAKNLLLKELGKKSYVPSPIALGSNTDPYQPIERRYRVTRDILEVLSNANHPATIVTKGAALIARDVDLLADMARRRLVSVFISITTLDNALKRTLEPRAASPASRLNAVRKLSDAGVPVGVMVAPVIPFLTDHETEAILEAASAAGALTAGYVMLRLPYEVAPLFREWLDTHLPLKAGHVMSRINALRSGRDNDPRFGTRQRGEGPYASIFRQRFDLALRRFGLDNHDRRFDLDVSQFEPPRADSLQPSLF